MIDRDSCFSLEAEALSVAAHKPSSLYVARVIVLALQAVVMEIH
jgi:hypothetical protein